MINKINLYIRTYYNLLEKVIKDFEGKDNSTKRTIYKDVLRSDVLRSFVLQTRPHYNKIDMLESCVIFGDHYIIKGVFRKGYKEIHHPDTSPYNPNDEWSGVGINEIVKGDFYEGVHFTIPVILFDSENLEETLTNHFQEKLQQSIDEKLNDKRRDLETINYEIFLLNKMKLDFI